MNYSEEDKREIWKKRKDPKTETTGYDSYLRKIHWEEYGARTRFGWRLDHIIPKSQGGADSVENMRPLHWKSSEGNPNLLPLGRLIEIVARGIRPRRMPFEQVAEITRRLRRYLGSD